MKTLLKIKNKKFRTIVYVVYLWGINTNNAFLRKKYLKLKMASFLPWRLVTLPYKNLLMKMDFIIANSYSCSYLLKLLYDVYAAGTVYTPVGVDIRYTIENEGEFKGDKSGILIMAGHLPDSYIRDLENEVRILEANGISVNVVVQDSFTRNLFERVKGIKVHQNVPLKELVSLYYKSEFTYVPTTYELFGLMGAESIFCGTPVILDVFHPFVEQVPAETKAVTIADHSLSIFDTYMRMKKEKINVSAARNSIMSNYSETECASSLLKILMKE
ncbi:MAG: hypothetical protein QXU98_06215 [Candidatus Parvarchaeota archaeon]